MVLRLWLLASASDDVYVRGYSYAASQMRRIRPSIENTRPRSWILTYRSAWSSMIDRILGTADACD
ncbi:hypothetical protein N9L68_03605 [bacterium]|nr:hypothetical protein [bacterium]